MKILKKIKTKIVKCYRNNVAKTKFEEPLYNKYTYLKILPTIAIAPLTYYSIVAFFVSSAIIFDFSNFVGFDNKKETKIQLIPSFDGVNLEETILTKKSILKNEVNLDKFMSEYKKDDRHYNKDDYFKKELKSYREELIENNIKENDVHYFIETYKDGKKYYSTDKFGVIGLFSFRTSNKDVISSLTKYRDKLAKDYKMDLTINGIGKKHSYFIDLDNKKHFYDISSIDVGTFKSFEILISHNKPFNEFNYINTDYIDSNLKYLMFLENKIDDIVFSHNIGLSVPHIFDVKFYKKNEEVSVYYSNVNINSFSALSVGMTTINNIIIKNKKEIKKEVKYVYIKFLFSLLLFLMGLKIQKILYKKDKIERTRRFILNKTPNNEILLLEDKSKCNKINKILKQKIIL
jgi:stress response protein YsnF